MVGSDGGPITVTMEILQQRKNADPFGNATGGVYEKSIKREITIYPDGDWEDERC